MAGPALALQYILLAGWLGLILIILYYTVRKWRTPKKSIPSGLLFLGLAFITGYFYYGMKQDEYKG
jgi:hypothetical protein